MGIRSRIAASVWRGASRLSGAGSAFGRGARIAGSVGEAVDAVVGDLMDLYDMMMDVIKNTDLGSSQKDEAAKIIEELLSHSAGAYDIAVDSASNDFIADVIASYGPEPWAAAGWNGWQAEVGDKQLLKYVKDYTGMAGYSEIEMLLGETRDTAQALWDEYGAVTDQKRR